MAGRRPKPTAVKKLLGNPGKRPLNEDEPKPQGKAKCPRHLDSEARREWRRVSQELERLGLLTLVDRAALAAYCQCYSHVIKAEAEIRKHGVNIVVEKQDKQGVFHVVEVKKNPACTVLKDMLQLMRQYEVEFGMTPSSRSKVKAPTQVHVHKDSNPFEEIANDQSGDASVN